MKKLLYCKQCGKEIFAYPSEIKHGKKFCSVSCGTTYRNIHDNPTKNPEVRKKISMNHADMSGENNPMFGVRGKDAPSYIDGRNSFPGDTYKKILLASGRKKACEMCGKETSLNVHHKDGDHKNNDLVNLMWLCTSCHLKEAHNYKRDALGRFTGSDLVAL